MLAVLPKHPPIGKAASVVFEVHPDWTGQFALCTDVLALAKCISHTAQIGADHLRTFQGQLELWNQSVPMLSSVAAMSTTREYDGTTASIIQPGLTKARFSWVEATPLNRDLVGPDIVAAVVRHWIWFAAEAPKQAARPRGGRGGGGRRNPPTGPSSGANPPPKQTGGGGKSGNQSSGNSRQSQDNSGNGNNGGGGGGGGDGDGDGDGNGNGGGDGDENNDKNRNGDKEKAEKEKAKKEKAKKEKAEKEKAEKERAKQEKAEKEKAEKEKAEKEKAKKEKAAMKAIGEENGNEANATDAASVGKRKTPLATSLANKAGTQNKKTKKTESVDITPANKQQQRSPKGNGATKNVTTPKTIKPTPPTNRDTTTTPPPDPSGNGNDSENRPPDDDASADELENDPDKPEDPKQQIIDSINFHIRSCLTLAERTPTKWNTGSIDPFLAFMDPINRASEMFDGLEAGQRGAPFCFKVPLLQVLLCCTPSVPAQPLRYIAGLRVPSEAIGHTKRAAKIYPRLHFVAIGLPSHSTELAMEDSRRQCMDDPVGSLPEVYRPGPQEKKDFCDICVDTMEDFILRLVGFYHEKGLIPEDGKENAYATMLNRYHYAILYDERDSIPSFNDNPEQAKQEEAKKPHADILNFQIVAATTFYMGCLGDTIVEKLGSGIECPKSI